MNQAELLEGLIWHSRSLFERGYTYSTGGNLSHRWGQGFWVTGTNTSFGRLRPEEFALCDPSGAHQSGPKPSKEAPFHAALYRARPDVQAIVHLHAPHAIALSCVAAPTDTGNVLPVVTSGSVTRVGRLPLVEYLTPGSEELPGRLARVSQGVNAVLMQNHGVVTLGATLEQAVDIAEELEQNLRIWFLTGCKARLLSDDEMARSKPLNGARIEPGQQGLNLLGES